MQTELEECYQGRMETSEIISVSVESIGLIKCQIATIILYGFEEAASSCSILPGGPGGGEKWMCENTQVYAHTSIHYTGLSLQLMALVIPININTLLFCIFLTLLGTYMDAFHHIAKADGQHINFPVISMYSFNVSLTQTATSTPIC